MGSDCLSDPQKNSSITCGLSFLLANNSFFAYLGSTDDFLFHLLFNPRIPSLSWKRNGYLFEQNCSSLGYFASVQLLLCLQNHFPNDNSGHHERVKEIQDKIENSRCQLDKKSSALYNFYLETL